MKIHLIQNQKFETSFQKPTTAKDATKEAAVELQIPAVSEFINQVGEPEYTDEEQAFCKLLKKVLEGEEKTISVLKSIFTITGNTVEVRLEGKSLTRLLNECDESVRIDLWAEMEEKDDGKVATFNYPDIPLFITEEDDIVFNGKLELLAPSKHKFEEGIIYTGKICISIQVKTTPFEVKECPSKTPVLLLPEGVECDFELISENGARIPCHRRFLARNSTVLARMFETDWKESGEKACNMNVSDMGLKALLNFIYNANIDGPLGSPSIALELLETAHHYGIPLLEKAMRKLLMKQPVVWYTAEVALKLNRFTMTVDGCRDLKWKAVKVIETKVGDLQTTELQSLLDEDGNGAEELLAYK